MKVIKLLSLALMVTFGLAACNSTGNKTKKEKTVAKAEAKAEKKSACSGCPHASSCAETSCDDDSDVAVASNAKNMVYYFHYTKRCATCNAIEKATKEVVANLKDKVGFKSINLDEDSSKKLAEKYKVNGSTLLVVKEDAKKNLTNIAFLHARKSPDKYKTKLKEALN